MTAKPTGSALPIPTPPAGGSDAEITRLRAALRQIQDEGDVRANAIATATLGGSDAER